MSAALPDMSTTMLRAERATPANGAGNGHATTRNSDDAPLTALDLAAVVSEALARSGLSNKDAAYRMGLDKAHWSRQLNGTDGQHMSLQRLAKMPRAFWIELIQQLADPLGVVVAHPDSIDRVITDLLLMTQRVCAFAVQERALREARRR